MPTGNLPSEGKALFEEVYQKAKKGSCKGDEECAARTAWSAVKGAGWAKDKDGNWHKTKSLTEFSMRIDRASYDKATGERRVRIVASDTDEDNRKDSMSLELFNDFVDRIKKNEPVPEEFQRSCWKGGEPYISVSHYSDLDGKGVPGIVDATYVDGNYLKSKGKFNDTPLGRKCFEAICSDLYGETKDREDKVRISIAFLDYVHKHKSNNFVFDRLNSESICPQCLIEMLEGKNEGKIYLKGHLIHEALTRVPVNTRTSMEVDKSMADKILTRKDDASSIVGEDEAENLEELESKIVGKSDVLVTRAEEEAPGKAEEECKDAVTGEVDPDCMAKQRGETPSTPEKSEAKDKEEEEEKPKKKKVPADKEETKEEKAEFIRSIIREMKAETEVVIPSSSHPLDTYFSEFKNKFDAIMASEIAENEKLQSIQEPFNVLGTGIVSVVKSSIKPKEVTPEVQGQMDLVEALSKVMNPIAQKLDLVITQLSAPQVEKPMLPVPQRRSISPSVVQQVQQQQPVVKSETPNLRKLIEKTT